MPCSPICEREIACLAGWPLRVRDRLLPAALEPQMAHFTQLRESCMMVPEFLGYLARGRAARARSRDRMLSMCVRGAQRSEEAINRLLAPSPFGGTASGVRHDCHLIWRLRHQVRGRRHRHRCTAAPQSASLTAFFSTHVETLFWGRMRLHFIVRPSFLSRLPRAADATSHSLGPGRLRVRFLSRISIGP